MSVTLDDVIDFVLDAGTAYQEYEMAQDVSAAERALGEQLFGKAQSLGSQAAEMTEFQPFTVTSGTGGVTTTDATGGVTIGLSPEELALQNALLTGAGGLFDRAMVDPAIAQQELYEQLRAVQRPEEERARLALEERMLAQGRLGLSSDAYGGATPEMLAQAQAEQDAMLKANLAARSQSINELGTFSELGTEMLAGAYKPSVQALGLLGGGTNVAQLVDLGRREGAQQFGNLIQKGFDQYKKFQDDALTGDIEADQAAWDALRDLLGI